MKIVPQDKAEVFYDITRNMMIDVEQHNPSKIGYFGMNMTKGKPALTQSTIESYIGSLDDFYFSALITNENLMKWLETKPTERVLLFYEYFGLSTFNNKFDVAKIEHNKFKKSSMLERVVVKDVEHAISEKELNLKATLSKRTTLESLVNDEETKQNALDIKIKEKSSEIFSLPDEFQNYDLSGKEIELNDLKEKIIPIEKKDTSLLNDLKREIQEIDGEIMEIAFPPTIQDEIDKIEIEKSNYVPPIDLSDNINQLNTERDKMRFEYRDVQTTIKTLTEELSSIGESIVCEHCNKVIFDLDSKKVALGTKIAGLESDLIPLTEKGTTINGSIKEIEEKLKLHKQQYTNAISEKILTLKQNGDNLVIASKKELSAKKQKVTQQIESIESYLKAIQSNETLALKITALDREITQYRGATAQIEANNRIRNEIISIESEKHKVVGYIKDLNLEIAEAVAQIRVCENFISEKKQLIVELEEDIKKDLLYNAYLTVHDKFNGISKYIILKYLPVINNELNILLKDIVMFEVSLVFDNKAIEFFYKDSEGSRELFRVSGYQKTMASLALHYVLMKLTTINIPNFCFIDEIYGSVGLTNINYAQTLILKLNEIYDTVFFITHSEEFMEMTNNFMLVGKDKDMFSVICKKKNLKEEYFEFMDMIKGVSDLNERQTLEAQFVEKNK
jgi:DNA repair exonuclease SbcCD ATPase subunit